MGGVKTVIFFLVNFLGWCAFLYITGIALLCLLAWLTDRRIRKMAKEAIEENARKMNGRS